MSSANRIVIVGGGVAGLMLATRLGRTLGRTGAARVTLIDSHPTHLWKPMLHTIAAGTRDVARAQVAYLAHACSHGFTYQVGRMCGLDRRSREIVLGEMDAPDGSRLLGERRVPYDALVLALGSQANDFGIPGVRDVCHFIDSQPQAEAFNTALRCEALRSTVNDDALRVVIAGGGATGVELAAELSRMFEMATAYGDPQIRERLKLTLVESGSRVLGAFAPEISSATQAQLERLGFRVLTDTRIVCADRDGFYRDDGQLIPGDLLVWAAGVKAPDFLQGIGGLDTNHANQILVRATMQTAQDERIFAVGDCASLVPADGERALPPTAQVATQQAAHLSRHLGAWLEGHAIPPFGYRDHGALVSLSDYNAFGALGRFGFQRWHRARTLCAVEPRDVVPASSTCAARGCPRDGAVGCRKTRRPSRAAHPAGLTMRSENRTNCSNRGGRGRASGVSSASGASLRKKGVWQHTVAMLDAEPVECRPVIPYTRRAPIVRVLEIASELTITVSWNDAMGGNYGAQIWRVRKAHHPGVCALTGAPIDVGDFVYRPLFGDIPPLNADAMISAESIRREEPALQDA